MRIGNGVKKLGIDMGNSTICVVGEGENGEVVKAFANSVYSHDTELISGDVIEK